MAATAASTASPPRAVVAFADYGCSEGKNSVAALGPAARAALGAGATAVTVAHVDLPDNNWAAVEAAVAGAAGYGDNDAIRVETKPMEKGFYVACFPDASLDVIYASAAYHWASGNGLPAILPGGEIVPCGARDPEINAAAKKAAADDWAAILRLRARELRPGGRLVASQVVDDGPLDGVWTSIRGAWASMLADGLITQTELESAVMRAHRRSVGEWLAPLQEGGAAANDFTVITADTVTQVSPAYAGLQAGTTSAAAYGAWVRGFYEAVSRPVFEGAVGARGPVEAKRIVDTFYARLEERVAEELPPFEMANLVMVLERK